ncbi:hypothetical protein TELCIR_17324 [Teladorsagia circumcincta]|uniref:Uncharacterized protein n=1 Tax=Teladorsagia circumcincta TaxID=45464 RepID=A0A2G9TT25_TELCI|nr:hypothetical protein TELCIR_17324 [Teladorsagia circumcincta]
MVKNEANSSWTVEEVMKIYGSETKTEAKASKAVSSLVIPAGCSPYFVRRSASCANPFRKPEIKAPASQPCTAPSSLLSGFTDAVTAVNAADHLTLALPSPC